MKMFLVALAALAAVPALAQTASVPSGCQYQATFARPGDRYAATTLRVPRGGRCSHAVGGSVGGVAVIVPPRNGRAEATAGGVTYTPNPGFIGTDSYVFSARWTGGPVQVTVSVSVE